MNAPVKCRHCGTPFRGAEGGFCCAGCERVYHLIQDSGLEDFYAKQDRVGQPLESAPFTEADTTWAETLRLAAEAATDANGAASARLSVGGMTCAGCAWLVERLARREPGVRAVRCRLESGDLELSWKPGVFDLKMRNGNNEKHEFLFQFGFNGAELMAEGPLSKKKKASYLISYRYNDLVLFQKMGVSIGTNALPVYQDLSFKLNFPHKKGVTSIFGLGGLSDISILAEETGENDVYALDNSNTYYSSTVGILGLNHKRRIGNSSYVNFSLAYQTGINDIKNDTVDLNYQNPFLTYLNKSYINKLTSVAFYNKKLNSKNVFKTGLQTDVYFLNLNDSVYQRSIEEYVVLRSFKGNLMLFQPYFQYQYRPNPNMTFNVGVHYQILTNNNTGMIEPRAGWNWFPTEKSKISFGYGLHSQMLPMEVYFYETMVNNEKIKPNEKLGFSKSHHFILGYQHFFPFGIQAKAELYYQHLFDIPVDVNINSYSMANFGANFVDPFPMYMANNGLGRNYGLDLTLEKYLDKGFYFLVTGSLYQSFYTPSNGKEYNTAFSGDYTFNALSGYEFKFKPKKNGQQHSLTLDLKFTRNGGRRYTQILLEESIAINNEVRDNENAFSLKYDDYMKGDIRIGYRIVGKKITQEFALDMQNFTNRKNILLEQYNPNTQQIDQTFQTGRLPIGLYRIYF